MVVNRSNPKESVNNETFEIPKFWYKTKSFEYLESENLNINNAIKTSLTVIIEAKGALKSISKIAIIVEAKRMVL